MRGFNPLRSLGLLDLLRRIELPLMMQRIMIMRLPMAKKGIKGIKAKGDR